MDVDLAIRDHDALNHRADELLPVRERQPSKRAPHIPDKRVQAGVKLGLLLCRRALALDCFETTFDMCPPLP